MNRMFVFASCLMLAVLGVRTGLHFRKVAAKESKAVILNKNNFDDVIANSSKPILVDFWAAWCGPCNEMSPVIEEMAVELRKDFIIAKVNVDEEPNLMTKHQISTIPAFVFFHKGKMKKMLVGKQTKQDLVNALKELAKE